MTISGKAFVCFLVAISVCLAAQFAEQAAAVPVLGEESRVSENTNKIQSVEPSSKLEGIDLECFACKAIVEAVNWAWTRNSTEKHIESIIKDACILFKIEDTNVCSTIIPLFASEFFPVVAETALAPENACGFIGVCPNWVNPEAAWNVTLPPKPTQPAPAPAQGKADLRIIHLSDVHFDVDYTVGLSTDCGEPLCCRPPNPVGEPGKQAGPWGDYHCDSPKRLVESALSFIGSLPQDQRPHMVYWTGDIPPHDVWNQSDSQQLQALWDTVGMLEQSLPGVKVFPALGNHESSPVNSFPTPDDPGNPGAWLNDALAKSWARWLPEESLGTVRKYGFYATEPVDGLVVVSLNMNACNNLNWWLLRNQTDPAGELAWLIDTLSDAELKGKRVHILGHIPPGKNDCLPEWSWNFYSIITRFHETISGIFMGHTHKDEFQLFFDTSDMDTPVAVAQIGPSITPFTNLNPGFRLYDIHDGDFTVAESHTFFANLTEANADPTTGPVWKKLFAASEAYGLKDLSAASYNDAALRMLNDTQLMQTYWGNRVKQGPHGTCDEKCVRSTVCGLLTGRSHDKSKCKDLSLAEITAFELSEKLC